MNRSEFIDKLNELLGDIPEAEKTEAISFYNDYFDEAGEENEASVIEDLESPERVAQTIKAGLSDKPDENGEYSERGYQNRKFVDREELARRTATRNNTSSNTKTDTPGKVVLIILLCILAAPVVLPLGFAALATVFSIICAMFCIAVGLCLAGVGLLIAGIALIVVGFAKLIVAPFAALCLLGAGFAITGLSIMGILLIIMAASYLIPACVRGVVSLCQMPFKKKKEVAA